MPHKKKEISKNKTKKDPETELETNEESEEVINSKNKKPIDIEAALEPASIIEEKSDEDISLPTEDGDDVITDELSLDDEELNPFGDKWEQ